jgi:hypothetical protein
LRVVVTKQFLSKFFSVHVLSLGFSLSKASP